MAPPAARAAAREASSRTFGGWGGKGNCGNVVPNAMHHLAPGAFQHDYRSAISIPDRALLPGASTRSQIDLGITPPNH